MNTIAQPTPLVETEARDFAVLTLNVAVGGYRSPRTDAEDQVIRALAPYCTGGRIARLIGRGRLTVYTRAIKLGVTFGAAGAEAGRPLIIRVNATGVASCFRATETLYTAPPPFPASLGAPGVRYRECPSAPGLAVGDDGSVFSCQERKRDSLIFGPWHRPKIKTNIGGYLIVYARPDEGGSRYLWVHRLVLEAFVGPAPGPDHECRHLNGVRSDNRLDNLAWGTRTENASDKQGHGTQVRGEKVNTCKITEADARQIFALRERGLPLDDIAARYGINPTTVASIARGRSWKHLGLGVQPSRKGRQHAECESARCQLSPASTGGTR